MKKTLLSLALAAVSLSALALDWGRPDFLNGPYVIISNNQTVAYGATNVVFCNPNSFFERLSFSTNYNSGTITNGTTINGVPAPTNYNTFIVGHLVPPVGSFYPLLSLTNHVSTTNLAYFGPAWNDVPCWPDKNGNASTSVALHVVLNTDPYQQSSGGPTNTADFEFRKIVGYIKVPGQTLPYPLVSSDTSANDLLLFRLAVGGQTNYIFSTNLTSGQLAGAYGWRLTKVVSGNSTTNGEPVSGQNKIAFFLYDVSMDGWIP